MQNNGEPSRTALTAAAARAAHLIVDQEPLIFRDTLAATLLGERADELLDYHRLHGAHPVLAAARTAVVTRGRYTETRLAESGLTQYVILGAGLDTYAHRTTAHDTYAHRTTAHDTRVFEIDHPATQEWKRARLADAALPHPPGLAYVPVDLEQEPFATRLTETGFDSSEPAFVSWLGVAMYLTEDALRQTITELVGVLAPGSQIVVDHMLPEDLRDEAGQAYADAIMPFAAENGEPWLSFLSPADAAALLGDYGFAVREQVSQRASVESHLWERADPLAPAELTMLTSASLPRTGCQGP